MQEKRRGLIILDGPGLSGSGEDEPSEVDVALKALELAGKRRFFGRPARVLRERLIGRWEATRNPPEILGDESMTLLDSLARMVKQKNHVRANVFKKAAEMTDALLVIEFKKL